MTRRAQGVVLAVGLVLLAWNIQRSAHFIADDALISLRYAARLLDGRGLTWNDGERVEGYSNLLWILLVAIPGAFGVNLVRAAVGLGVASAAGIVVVVGRILRPLGAWPTLAGVMLVALSAPLGAWAVGGLEGPLHALLVLGAVARLLEPSAKRTLHAGLLLGLACWARPDTPILVAGLAAGTWLANGQNLAALRRAAVVALVPAAFVAAQLVFRVVYYQDWVPNTAYAKLDVASLDRAELGVLYLWPWLRAGGWVWLLGAVGLVAPPRSFRDIGRLLLPVLGLQLAWLLRVGGDHFVAWRLLLVLDPLRAVLAAVGGAAVAERLGRWVAIPVIAGAAAWHVHAQERENTIRQLRLERRWEWDAEPAGRLLGAAFGPSGARVATCAAGGIPYWSGLPALDPLGLTDRHIARQRLHPGGVGIPGHEASDTAYVLEQRPDLIVFCSPEGGDRACLPQEAELLARDELHSQYVLRWLRGTEPYAYTFGPMVRVDSAALGVRHDADGVWIPGWFWADDKNAPGELVDGRLVVRRKAGQVARLPITLEGSAEGVAEAETEPSGAAEAVVRDGGVEVRFGTDALLVGVRVRATEALPALARPSGW